MIRGRVIFKMVLARVYKKTPGGATSNLSFKQRHFLNPTVGINDAVTELNVAMLLGIDRSKEDHIWWDLLKEVARSKRKYNYELHVGYALPYSKIPDLGTTKALKLILRSFKSLKPIYELVTSE